MNLNLYMRLNRSTMHRLSTKQSLPEKKKGGFSTGKVIALVLAGSLLGGATGAGLTSIYTENMQSNRQPTNSSETVQMGDRTEVTIDINKIDTSKQMTAAEVYAQNVSSTVGIITTSVTTNFWGYQSTSATAGSGFIITEDGYILTNYHVVENSRAIYVTLYDDRTFDATLINYDENNDVAVLKIEAEGLNPVVLGDSEKMNVGDPVIAIGNPLGQLTFSLTSGAISALNREITVSSNLDMTLIQTDCAINSGNSGGPLFNLYGEVIGITNAKYTAGSGNTSIDNIGFAIPINDAWAIAKSIIEKGYVSKPYVGVEVVDVSQEMQNYGLPKGAAVKSVENDSPAEEAGLRRNDIITKVNDTEITSASQLNQYFDLLTIGEEITLSVYRQGTTLTLKLTADEQIQGQTQSTQSTQQSLLPYFPF